MRSSPDITAEAEPAIDPEIWRDWKLATGADCPGPPLRRCFLHLCAHDENLLPAICPVRCAHSKNVSFCQSAAAAEAGRIPPRLRCRPETAPGSPRLARHRNDRLAGHAFDRRGLPGPGKCPRHWLINLGSERAIFHASSFSMSAPAPVRSPRPTGCRWPSA